MSKRSLGMTIVMACLAMVVIVAKVEARGGRGGGGGGGGRAFSGGGGQFRGGGAGRGPGDVGDRQRGDLGGAIGGGLDGGDHLNGGLGAGDRLNGGLGREDGLAGEGTRSVADGAKGEKQLQQFLGLPPDGARGVADHGPGDRGDGRAGEQASQRAGELRDNAQNWVNKFNAGNEPFSAGWYADHPNAWQYTHPHADAWAAAGLAATTAWIGAAAYDDGGDYSTTVVNEAPDDEDDSTAQSVSPESPLAANVAADDQSAAGGDWLSLGVYALEPPAGGEKELLQLAVSKAGEIKGVYYNADDNLTENITGTVDRATQLATWNVVSTPELQFSASLQALTSSTGEVNVTAPNGVQQTWFTARLQQPQDAAAGNPSSSEEVISTP
ncbi:hypothetical protein [Lacipirellula limnantheis]|uniref:Uncharacterized protein n=1 Tax=Lacipirellula limnantheis TaxID=2528024 RepID=A0A517U6I9_9BACT|nr:hypothetical protein [Lacipirellula limnantheis]QDT76251.1 hypothetical protein I41_55010 [Lacipirellula limnantheis]